MPSYPPPWMMQSPLPALTSVYSLAMTASSDGDFLGFLNSFGLRKGRAMKPIVVKHKRTRDVFAKQAIVALDTECRVEWLDEF